MTSTRTSTGKASSRIKTVNTSGSPVNESGARRSSRAQARFEASVALGVTAGVSQALGFIGLLNLGAAPVGCASLLAGRVAESEADRAFYEEISRDKSLLDAMDQFAAVVERSAPAWETDLAELNARQKRFLEQL